MARDLPINCVRIFTNGLFTAAGLTLLAVYFYYFTFVYVP